MLQITIKALKYLELRAHGMTSSLEREFHRRLDRKWNDGRDKIWWGEGPVQLRMTGRIWSNHIYGRGDSIFFPVSSREPPGGQGSVCRGSSSHLNKPSQWTLSCSGCSLVRLPVNSSSGQPSIIQQIWCLCMPQNFALFKVLVIYRCLRWRMEPGYLRNGDVVKQTTVSLSRSLRRASLRRLSLGQRGPQPNIICTQAQNTV